jgi:hypothetical protein
MTDTTTSQNIHISICDIVYLKRLLVILMSGTLNTEDDLRRSCCRRKKAAIHNFIER